MGDRAVILESPEPPPSPHPPATFESSSGDPPWQTDAAAPANAIVNRCIILSTLYVHHEHTPFICLYSHLVQLLLQLLHNLHLYFSLVRACRV